MLLVIVYAFRGIIPGLIVVALVISTSAFFVGDTATGALSFVAMLPVIWGLYIGDRYSVNDRTHAEFLMSSSLAMFIICMLLALFHTYIFEEAEWQKARAILLFIGVLTLANAPFDFFSLGLTRFLLRLGLDFGGIYPYMFAIMDLCISIVLITFLSIGIVLSVDLFNNLAAMNVHTTGEAYPVVPGSSKYGMAT